MVPLSSAVTIIILRLASSAPFIRSASVPPEEARGCGVVVGAFVGSGGTAGEACPLALRVEGPAAALALAGVEIDSADEACVPVLDGGFNGS